MPQDTHSAPSELLPTPRRSALVALLVGRLTCVTYTSAKAIRWASSFVLAVTKATARVSATGRDAGGTITGDTGDEAG